MWQVISWTLIRLILIETCEVGFIFIPPPFFFDEYTEAQWSRIIYLTLHNYYEKEPNPGISFRV